MICNFEQDDVLWALGESTIAVADIAPMSLLGVANALLNPASFRTHPRFYDGGAMTLVQASKKADMGLLLGELSKLVDSGEAVAFKGKEASTLFPGLRTDRTYYIHRTALKRVRATAMKAVDIISTDASIMAAILTTVMDLPDDQLERMGLKAGLDAGGSLSPSAQRIRTVLKSYQEKTCSVSTAN